MARPDQPAGEVRREQADEADRPGGGDRHAAHQRGQYEERAARDRDALAEAACGAIAETERSSSRAAAKLASAGA